LIALAAWLSLLDNKSIMSTLSVVVVVLAVVFIVVVVVVVVVSVASGSGNLSACVLLLPL
jgi:hypothetical protein